MDNLSLFLSENKIKRQNVKIALTDSFKDSEGNTLLWELRPVTTQEAEEIKAEATEYSEKGSRLNIVKYAENMVTKAVVYPNLYNAELQDSYGVKTPQALLKAMVDSPGDYARLEAEVQKLNGFTSVKEDIDRAKN